MQSTLSRIVYPIGSALIVAVALCGDQTSPVSGKRDQKPAAADSDAKRFQPVVWNRVHGQIFDVTYKFRMNGNYMSPRPARTTRQITTSLAIWSPEPDTLYRLDSPPRLLAFLDQDGAPIETSRPLEFTQRSIMDGGPTPWRRSPNQIQPKRVGGLSFQLTADGLTTAPREISRISFEVDVRLSTAESKYNIELEVSDEFQELVPGLVARVNAIESREQSTQVGLLFRSQTNQSGQRPMVAFVELLDEDGEVLSARDRIEVTTSGDEHLSSIALSFAGRQNHASSIRVIVVERHESHTMTFSERDIVLAE